MTWIKTLTLADAPPALRAVLEEQRAQYPLAYEEPVPGLSDKDGDGIVAAHSLIPDALKHAFATFAACMSPALPLARRDHEMIATVVSSANCTAYCSASHREFLRRVTLDAKLADALASDYRSAGLDARDNAMLAYAVQITRNATLVTRQHHDELRQVGFDDTAILQITIIAAWFNYINRMADALGVGRD
jgi:uncharacterized peroxidase-related enzyme